MRKMTKVELERENELLKQRIATLEQRVRDLQGVDGTYRNGKFGPQFIAGPKPDLHPFMKNEADEKVHEALCQTACDYSEDPLIEVVETRFDDYYPGCNRVIVKYTYDPDDGIYVIEWWPAVQLSD